MDDNVAHHRTNQLEKLQEHQFQKSMAGNSLPVNTAMFRTWYLPGMLLW